MSCVLCVVCCVLCVVLCIVCAPFLFFVSVFVVCVFPRFCVFALFPFVFF